MTTGMPEVACFSVLIAKLPAETPCAEVELRFSTLRLRDSSARSRMMNRWAIEQIGTPIEICREPVPLLRIRAEVDIRQERIDLDGAAERPSRSTVSSA
jgi:hypothetical protein